MYDSFKFAMSQDAVIASVFTDVGFQVDCCGFKVKISGIVMVGIVRIALKRPYTFVVLAILILIVGPLAALRTPTDIFPDIRIPVVAVIWQYTGLPPDQMEGRIVSPFERVLTTVVNDVEHIEGKSVTGYGVVKIFFQ